MSGRSIKVEGEKLLERKLFNGVRGLGGIAFKFLPFVINGIPDRVCLLPKGRVFFAEIKTTGKSLRPLQKVLKRKLRELGFEVWEIDNSDIIKKILESYE